MKLLKTLKSRSGQTAIEYIFTTVALFFVFLSFYIFYSKTVPLQFEQGAKVILTVYESKD
ncbi:hypothetical protein Emin_1211 [Elusimicrobium minutum Pei191]|uniref:Uncharacterized protein n=1 Tax=Elusimicrobium minutum (strain Pei191) TaxID=445932 RepID=B2KE15_ELUMP|nr:hypothetical protein [Elusimicrobium minutum]ACC98761.1 hypothetical protein Emin_1211 [Elusimicrobium minutum Pei191]